MSSSVDPIINALPGAVPASKPAGRSGIPGHPASGPQILLAIATAEPGAGTVATVRQLCLTEAAAKQVQQAVASYEDARTNAMLVPAVWNLPTDYRTGEYFQCGLDRSCATGAEPGLAN